MNTVGTRPIVLPILHLSDSESDASGALCRPFVRVRSFHWIETSVIGLPLIDALLLAVHEFKVVDVVFTPLIRGWLVDWI